MRKDTTSELVGQYLHYPFFMLNVKQESCEYQLGSTDFEAYSRTIRPRAYFRLQPLGYFHYRQKLLVVEKDDNQLQILLIL